MLPDASCNCYCLKNLMLYPAMLALFLGALLNAVFYIFIKKSGHRKKKRAKPHISLLKAAGTALFFLGFILALAYLLLPFILGVLAGGLGSPLRADCFNQTGP